MSDDSALYGVMAEFSGPEEILNATEQAWAAGYRDMDAYSPYCVEGLAARLGCKGSKIPAVVFVGGVVGAGAGFFMQYYSMAVDYPLNVGGRPYNSWPVFLPVAFEVLVLVASLAAFISMLVLNGLPQPYHPVFNVPAFARASQDRFFLCIEATDPKFDREETARFLLGLAICGDVCEVPLEQLTPPPDVTVEARPATPSAPETVSAT